MSSEKSKIHIIGAGIMGLMIARNLIAAGQKVIVYDKGGVGAESSWAGGGILSPLYPWRQPEAITRLAARSQQLYPEIIADLLSATEVDPELALTGMLVLTINDLEKAHAWAAKNLVKIRMFEDRGLAKIEPNLPNQFGSQALHFPEVGHVRNPRLIKAIRVDLLQKGCEFRENTEINDIKINGQNVQKLVTSEGEIEASKVVVSTGAWTGKLLGKLGLDLPIEPIAGQMLLYKAEPGVVRNIILKNKRYLIPRRDGRILVGSTLENAGFQKLTTESALHSLQESALEMLPELSKYSIEKQWAGLRPGSPQGIPYMGVYPDVENLWVCSGHYRNGLILAPASAEFMSNMILGNTTPDNRGEYSLDRASKVMQPACETS